MVDRVGNTPQLGGRNLNELVAGRDSQSALTRSVSGPPATAVARSSSKAPDTEPAIKAPDTGEQIDKARERRRRLESSTLSVQQAARGTNTSSQLRELTGQAIEELDRRRPSPERVQPELAQNRAGAALPQGTPGSGGDNGQASKGAPVVLGGGEASVVEQTGAGGNAGQSRGQAAPAVSEPKAAPTLQTGENHDPQAAIETGPPPEVALPNSPESSADNGSANSSDVPEVRGDVVNIVA